jgi:phosphate transport system ATP-binding protein
MNTTKALLVDNPAPKISVKNLSFRYGKFLALKNVSIEIEDRGVLALIGPSGCGKTTLLRCLNRMHDLYTNCHYSGAITLMPEGWDLLAKETDPIDVRLRFGMVFQKPNPFPKSVFDNVAYGLRVRGVRSATTLNEKVEKALKSAALWDEVKDRLHGPAFELSGGQQQRLCIARALSPEPEVLLLDEPTSALDPIATGKIEELIGELKKNFSIVIVTHSMQQALRISDRTAFMYIGELIEVGRTKELFNAPKQKLTGEYIGGSFG